MSISKSAAIFVSSLSIVICAAAQRHETFAQRPAKRQDEALRALTRAQREKGEARQWARTRSLPMRYRDGDRVTELMAIRNGRPVYYTTLNANAALSTAANQVRQTAPFNVDGTGLAVGVWDVDSILTTHVEFGDRVTLRDGGTATDIHSTHVGGTIGAVGNNASVKGMAPAVHIDSYDWSGDEGEMILAAASYAGEPDTIYLSNHSYGTISGWIYGSYSGQSGYHWYGDDILSGESDFFGQYDYYGRYWDEIVYDAPYYLPFKAAGNDRNDTAPSEGTTFFYYESNAWQTNSYNSAIHPPGDGTGEGGYDTILPKGNAKNIMTVGAITDAGDGSSRILTSPYADMTTFSGWGPADDGRIKPDIVANGSSLNSTLNSGVNSYGTMSGTSMASPNACGSAALLADYYDDRFPGDAMRASTLKGLIIHTADDLGNPGPDYSFGWGLMNTVAAAELIKYYADGDTLRMTEAQLSNSHKSDTVLLYSDGYEPVRVTLCWTDPPGTYSTSLDDRIPDLVNDLDLKVTGPGGTYDPYKLDYTNPSANATSSGENNIDNVEQVYIAAPLPGFYTITVDHDGVLTDGSQWYSLLTSGTSFDSDADGMSDYWETMYFSNPTGAVASVDSDGDGTDNLSEYTSGHHPKVASSVFSVTNFSAAAPGGPPFIVSWDPVPGRVYGIYWSDDLLRGFANISSNLFYPTGSYTDTVERTGSQQFYRIEVRTGP